MHDPVHHRPEHLAQLGHRALRQGVEEDPAHLLDVRRQEPPTPATVLAVVAVVTAVVGFATA